ncbi:murein biosynthesis integral membrane protein MurJ [Saccharopolyspora taberi]|uniref:Murein biosynthesis integral membrane protein MurJ n=1 Tax=Saccharopolyspora taberi TaxID=60895 RepID=A0ABN3VN95_9PSEU
MNRDRGHPARRVHPSEHPTRPIQRRPAPPQAERGWHAAPTQPIPAVVPEPGMDQAAEQAAEQTQVIRPVSPGRKSSLLRSSGSMAIATLISRITGFLWKLMLGWTIGVGVVNSSFTVANNLPNSIFEFLIGGVLTSVIVPVLVRAGKSDADGGEAYVQRLLSISVVVLGIGTVLSVIGASWLVALYASGEDKGNPELATAFAYFLLPQIFFYGISALISAILQSKEIFSPPAWAPVVNNLVVIATIAVLWLQPGELVIDPARWPASQTMLLGIGVTLGVVAQALIQIPALRRTGIRFRWRWGWDRRLTEFGGLALWMIAYVGISQLGLMAMSKAGTSSGTWAMYNTVWMLLQLPYGVIGFSVMTAILPRMSSAAADGDHQRVIDDLSLGNRLSTVTLLPISAVMCALGTPMVLALLGFGESAGDVDEIGLGLALSAFGVLPYAITMMQMRVFYAMKDARTPTLIMVIMTAFKIPLSLWSTSLETPVQVLAALTIINSASFVVGWLVGEVWLRHRIGPLGSRRFLVTLGKTLVASVVGGALGWLAAVGIDAIVPGPAGPGTGWLQSVLGSVIALAAIFGLMWVLRVAELQPAIGRLTGLLRRR